MKKSIILLTFAVSIFLLTACGNSYDDEIDQVIELENEELDKPSTKTDLDSLDRDETQIWVYEDAEYIELEYVIRDKYDTATPVYKHNGDQYERYSDSDFNKNEVDDLEADYTENVDDDD